MDGLGRGIYRPLDMSHVKCVYDINHNDTADSQDNRFTRQRIHNNQPSNLKLKTSEFIVHKKS